MSISKQCTLPYILDSYIPLLIDIHPLENHIRLAPTYRAVSHRSALLLALVSSTPGLSACTLTLATRILTGLLVLGYLRAMGYTLARYPRRFNPLLHSQRGF